MRQILCVDATDKPYIKKGQVYLTKDSPYDEIIHIYDLEQKPIVGQYYQRRFIHYEDQDITINCVVTDEKVDIL